MKTCKQNFIVMAIAALTVLTLSTCFSEWKGDTGKLIINLGGSSGRSAVDMPWPPDKFGILDEIEYEITLTGNGEIITITASGGEIITAVVFAGLWDVYVEAYYKDDPSVEGKGNLYATGTNDEPVDVKEGQTTNVPIKMNKAFLQVHDWDDWIVSADAAETTDGEETRTCLGCGETETRIAYATGTAGLDYALIDGDNAYRVNQGSAAGDIVIPAFHRPNPDSGYLPVTTISDGTDGYNSNAFGGKENSNTDNDTVNSITFAAGSQLTTISGHAFYRCTGLKSITLPESLKSIGYCAFQDCTGLDSITIPAGVTELGSSAFYNWTNTQTIYIQGKTLEEANAAWPGTETEAGTGNKIPWNRNCYAEIVYEQ